MPRCLCPALFRLLLVRRLQLRLLCLQEALRHGIPALVQDPDREDGLVGAHLVVVSSRPRQGRILLLSFGCARKRREAVQPGDVLVDIFALCVRVLRTLQVRFWVHGHGVGMT